ncbi:MAG TPA: hypothetical protein VMY77_02820 [Chitinophagaceae bacterium]|nr:hypothetical protein [Chitinophagaceae bacterium]
MDARQQSLQELQQIKKMMERSSKFISLSGLSGISAGICALAGAWLASVKIDCWLKGDCNYARSGYEAAANLENDLLLIAIATFTAAFITSFLFTYLRSKKTGTPLWGTTAYRLFWNVLIPLAAGGLFLLRTMQLGQYELIAPGCLIFYGLALVNCSKYTLGEVRFLGYGQIILGIINLWMTGYGLYFWAAGFGLLHIIYGTLMWYKYERVSSTNDNNE